MNRLLLVDGSNLLFQMFYGMPARIVNAQGKAIQGTLGFTGALLKIIRMTQPTHMAVLFDGEHPSERALLDSDYKSDRPDHSQMPEEDTPFSQLADVYAALRLLRIPHAETTVCETDDWMAGYALRFGKDMEIVIASFDSDFFQLISPQVSVLRYRGKQSTLCTPEWLKEHFGILPDQYAAFKSLTGDSADHIRGVKHIGPKTAALLLNEFGTLDNLLANAAQIRRPSIREAISQNADRIRRNFTLIQLNGDSPLPFSLSELAYADSGLNTTQVLKGIGLK